MISKELKVLYRQCRSEPPGSSHFVNRISLLCDEIEQLVAYHLRLEYRISQLERTVSGPHCVKEWWMLIQWLAEAKKLLEEK